MVTFVDWLVGELVSVRAVERFFWSHGMHLLEFTLLAVDWGEPCNKNNCLRTVLVCVEYFLCFLFEKIDHEQSLGSVHLW